MNDALLVEVLQPVQDLEDVQPDERFGNPPEFADQRGERTVLAVFEDDVERGGGAVVASVLDNVGICGGGGRVEGISTSASGFFGREVPGGVLTVQILEQVDLGL
jgi:hypothetical protein